EEGQEALAGVAALRKVGADRVRLDGGVGDGTVGEGRGVDAADRPGAVRLDGDGRGGDRLLVLVGEGERDVGAAGPLARHGDVGHTVIVDVRGAGDREPRRIRPVLQDIEVLNEDHAPVAQTGYFVNFEVVDGRPDSGLYQHISRRCRERPRQLLVWQLLPR